MSDPRLQAAYDAIDAYGENHSEARLLINAKCKGLMFGYHERWKDAGLETVNVERTIQADLVNPDTNAKSRTFTSAGKIDVLAERRASRILLDGKTTSQDIADPNSPYWRQLVIEGQVSHYHLLLWQLGEKVDDAIWDVVRKPSIAPKKLAKGVRASTMADRKYCGRLLSTESLEHLQSEERETLEMYEARLAHDCTNERPEWYFQRRSVPRLDSEILEYAREHWGHGQEIIHTRRTGRHARNSGACFRFGRPCKFLGICSGHDNSDSDKWQRKKNVHIELPELKGDGRNVLTNSRIRCFLTCRKLHFFEYELGIEQIGTEEAEALVMGNTWHAALEAWWSYS